MRGNTNAIKPLHHYSTTEQVVGTWIDGKPIYEKTFYFNNVQLTNDNNTSQLIHNLSDVDNGFIINSYYKNTSVDNFWRGTNLLIAGSSTFGCNMVFGSISFFGGSLGEHSVDAYPERSFIIVVQYTKTTDTAPSA